MTGSGKVTPRLASIGAEDDCPPANAQQAGLWFIHESNPSCSAYHIVFSFEATVDPAVGREIMGILDELITEHEALRVSFGPGANGPVTRVIDHVAGDIRQTDARNISPEELPEIVRSDTREPFDLSQAPLWRVHIYRTGENTWVTAVVMHHVAFDFWTLALLIKDVRSRLESPSFHSELDGSAFCTYAEEQRQFLASDRARQLLEVEQKRLDDTPPLRLSSDYTRPPTPSYEGGSVAFSLPKEVTEGIKNLSREVNATPYMVLLSAYLVLLRILSDQSSVAVGTPTSGRLRRNYRNAIGNFVNTVVVKGEVDLDLTYRDVIGATRERVLAALHAQEIPFPRLVRELAPTRGGGSTPLFQVGFAWDRIPFLNDMSDFFVLESGSTTEVVINGMTIRPFPLPQQEGQADLWVEMGAEANGSYGGTLRYSADIFSADTGRALADAFVATVKSLVISPDAKLHDLVPAEIYAGLRKGRQALSPVSPFAGDPDTDATRSHASAVSDDIVGVPSAEKPEAVDITPRVNYQGFLAELLDQVDEPTVPYGIFGGQDIYARVTASTVRLDSATALLIHEQAQRAEVSTAAVFYMAWGLALARITGQKEVLFGSVMFGPSPDGNGPWRGLDQSVDILPFRIRVDGVEVKQSLHQTQALLADPVRHEGAQQHGIQGSDTATAAAPLFTSLLNYRQQFKTDAENRALMPGDAESFGWAGFQSLPEEERKRYPVTVWIDESGSDFAITTQVMGGNSPATEVDPSRVGALVAAAVSELATALGRDPGVPGSQLDVLPPTERDLVLQKFNDTRMYFTETDSGSIHHMFEAQAARFPDVIAVMHEREGWTYSELNARANRVAHRLRSAGVGPDVLVGVCAERGLPLIAGLLGVLKAGGAYVPLDPHYPLDRLRDMLSDSRPAAILVNGPLASEVASSLDYGSGPGPQLVDLSALLEGPGPAWLEENPVVTGLNPDHLAYVIYTSGSTGRPKGVMVEHRNVVNLINWARTEYSPAVLARVMFSTSVNFDISVFEVFVPLSVGGAVVVVEDALAPMTQDLDVTLLNTVPSAMAVLASSGRIPASVRSVNVAGEPLRRQLVQQIFASAPGVAEIHNLFGPTEATVYATGARMPRQLGYLPHIGQPLPNVRIYILNERMEPVPVGAVGELFVGGAGVARGYMNRGALTKERFVPDPFDASGGQLYRTGDLGRWFPDGSIEFQGRNDFQVKIRGFRIELGEIEAHLLEHPRVREASVAVREDSTVGPQLVAYYVSTPVASATDSIELGGGLAAGDLREHLARTLPDHMIPSAFVSLDALPLTVTGKIDRSALPAPIDDAFTTTGYEPPIGDTETALAKIWADALGLERVGRHDNFFDVGGHSMLAVALVQRMRDAGLTVDVRTLVTDPTVAALAAILERENSGKQISD